jgi:hypothetical protein
MIYTSKEYGLGIKVIPEIKREYVKCKRNGKVFYQYYKRNLKSKNAITFEEMINDLIHESFLNELEDIGKQVFSERI